MVRAHLDRLTETLGRLGQLLSAAAYVLLDQVRRRGLAGTQLERAQAGIIPLKLLTVGARVVNSVRRGVLQLGSGYPLCELFTSPARKLIALPALPMLPRCTAAIVAPAAAPTG
jgi:hypothetical protein